MPAPHPLVSPSLRAAVAASAGALLLSACAVFTPVADPVRYFTLGAPLVSGSVVGGDSDLVLQPVRLAGHLRSPNLVIRLGESEIRYDERVRWAEPLDETITARLRAQLASRRSRSRLRAAAEPAAASPPRVAGVRIERFELVREDERARGGRVQIVAEWSLDGHARARFESSPREWDGRDVGALVALMREALAELAVAFAAELEQARSD